MLKIKPLFIGKIKIEIPVMVAPLAGVTDLPFRKIIKKFGCPLMFSEMLSSKSLVNEKGFKKNIKKLMSVKEKYYGIQIFGDDPYIMSEAAKICEDFGADLIDINMGCPVKKIVKSGGGADLLKTPQLAENIIKKVSKAIKIPLTVKTRIGWDSSLMTGKDIAKAAENGGANMITIHGRTRAQMYSGKANWETIEKIKKTVSIPVVGNGDIIDEKTAEIAFKNYDIDGIMIGRGILGKPWLISHIIYFLNTGNILSTPTIEAKKDIALEHFKEIITYYGEKKGILLFRKHLSWYSKGLPQSAEFRLKINQKTEKQEIISIINDYMKV